MQERQGGSNLPWAMDLSRAVRDEDQFLQNVPWLITKRTGLCSNDRGRNGTRQKSGFKEDFSLVDSESPGDRNALHRLQGAASCSAGRIGSCSQDAKAQIDAGFRSWY